MAQQSNLMHLVSNQVAGLIDTSRIETDKFKNPPQAEYNIVDFTFLKSKNVHRVNLSL